VADRFGFKPIQQNVLDRRVPKTPWYFGDGATLAGLFGVLVLTGMMMGLSYSPSPDSAYQSVKYITERQFLGWFVRGLHYWSAGLMMVMLFAHLFRQILLGGYKFPREGTWLIGVLLFFGVLTMSFTGYLLRWDERAIYAIKVVLHMFDRVPLIGEYLVLLVQGDAEMGPLTLTRLFAVHVLIVPMLLMGLIGFHLYLVIYHGVTSRGERRQPVQTPEDQKRIYKEEAHSEERGETFHPRTTFQSGLMAIIVIGFAVVLTLIWGPADLYPEANLVDPSVPAEEWWYWWYSALIALLPSWIAPWFVVVFPIALFLVLVALPFVDRGPNRGMRRRPIALVIVVICIIGLLYLSDLRRRSPWTGWPDPNPPQVPAGVELAADAEQGRLLFAQYGCNSCHAVAGDGAAVAVDLARITRRLSREELRAYILNPPADVAMPRFEGRLTEEELDRIVEYVLVAQTFPREP
jgi:ubiquinol-cytochrome c reductase cytochrome b subunit